MKTRAIRIYETGSPDVMKLEEVDLPEPGPGEIRIKNTAIGVNFTDTYMRAGLNPAKMPTGLGSEGAGIVDAIGEGVTRFKVGDRAAYCMAPIGAYAQAHNVMADKAVPIPEGITDEQAAAMMLKGLTVRYLIKKSYAVQPGDTILWHSAAGGVGLIACQWLKHLGATVIGTVGSEEKARLTRAHGADHTILYQTEDVAARVKEITGGKMVPAVYDAVGMPTFQASLNSLRPRGHLVSYGNASGEVVSIPDLRVLSAKGSVYISRPTLNHFYTEEGELDEGVNDMFDLIKRNIIRVQIHQRYALAEVAQCHKDLANRKTTGASILTP